MADILDAGGVSRGSFYFYFPNRHAVLADLVRRAMGSAREAAGAWADDESGAPGAALRQGTREGSRLWLEHAPVLRAIVENWQSDPAAGADDHGGAEPGEAEGDLQADPGGGAGHDRHPAGRVR